MANAKEVKSNIFKKGIKRIFELFNYEIKRKNNFNDRYSNFIAEADNQITRDLDKFEKICLASKLNLWSIIKCIEHLKNENIEGDFVECGVYNGATIAFIANNLIKNSIEKNIWGFDTFEDGFIEKTYHENDVDLKQNKMTYKKDNSFYFTLNEVKKNIKENTEYDFKKINLIKGNIIETLNNEENLPKKISFLRLDTDLYLTTKKQLEILYPRLNKGGILHIDDYGFFSGVRKAVDEYFQNKKIWLHRVDMTCRYLIKN